MYGLDSTLLLPERCGRMSRTRIVSVDPRKAVYSKTVAKVANTTNEEGELIWSVFVAFGSRCHSALVK